MSIDSNHKKSLTETASKSVFWKMVGTFGVSGMRFISTAILARILVPADFGLIAMAVLFTGVIRIFGEIGMGAALIQRRDVDQEYYSTAHWASVAVGIFLATLGILSAPLSAVFFEETLVKPLIQFLSINFVLSAICAIHATILTRNFRFKTFAQIEIVTTIVRIAVIIGLALEGWGVWSIIYGIITERLLKTMMIMHVSKWMPTFEFNKEKFTKLFHFGRNIYGNAFLVYLKANLDFIITGKVLGKEQLAYYQFAFNIPNLVVSQVSQNLREIIFSLYCSINDDNERLKRGFLKTMKYLGLLTVPLMFGLFYTADEFIFTAYGSQWGDAIAPLRILAIPAAIRALTYGSGQLISAKGRPDITLKWSIATLPVTLLALVIGARWGIVGVATAMSATVLFTIYPAVIACKMINISLKEYIHVLRPIFVPSFLMLGVLWIMEFCLTPLQLENWLKLIIFTFTGGISCLIFLIIFFNRDFNELRDTVSLMVKRTPVKKEF